MDAIEYTPQQPKQQPAPKPEFVLVNDMTGKPPPKRGPQVMKAYMQDESGSQVVKQFKVPFPPKPNCKKCFGRGYIGIEAKTGNQGILLCKKCYPML